MPERPLLPKRDGTVVWARLIELYLMHYEGRDPTRAQRLQWWSERIGELTVLELPVLARRARRWLEGVASWHLIGG